jgi:hypothetical protein
MKTILPLLILILSLTGMAQTDLPDKGALTDIKGKNKAYLVSDTQNAKVITKEISKKKNALVLVNKAADADFVVEYRTTATEPTKSSLDISIVTGQMDVYTLQDGKKTIVWTDSSTKSMSYPSVALINRFIKALTALK